MLHLRIGGIDMIVERMGGRKVLIRTRDNNGTRCERVVGEFYPYGFLTNADARYVPCHAKEPGYTGVFGESLTKIIMADPADIGSLKNKFDKTWECNIPFTNRVLSELYKKTDEIIPNYKHRVWYLDMEWDCDDETITIITVFDSFTEKYFTWVYDMNERIVSNISLKRIPCKNHPDGLEYYDVGDNPDMIFFSSESIMLQHFTNFMNKHDPDVITGWNVVNADIKVLIDRLNKNNIDPKKLCGGRSKVIRYEFTDWAQPIGGRLVIDLMVAVSHLWQIKNGALPNKKLDTVSSILLNDRKVDLPDGHDTYWTDLGTYIDYNVKDVRLLPLLDKKVNAINHYLAIQHIVQCDIQTTPFVTRLFTVMAMNDKNFNRQIPSKPMFQHQEYSGADIMEPSPGVYQNVAIMDIRAMYHSNVNLHNISWETLDEKGVDCGNGSKFQKEAQGLLGRQMDKMTILRNQYKDLMKKAENDDERAMYDAMQYATKSLVASMYGAAGDSKYGLYHPDIASAITFTSRQTLFKLREECESLGMKVIYGHTDSVFVISPLDEAKEKVKVINDRMSPIITEFEKWCSSMLIMAKNRYAGMTAWEDGSDVEGKLYVKGIELKQNRLPNVMKKVMSKTIENLLSGVDEKNQTDWLVGLINDVISGNVNDEDLCIKARLKDDLSQYKVLAESRAAAAWANKKLGKGYRKNSDYLCTIDSNGEYIGFDNPSEIHGIATIGYSKIVDTFIITKVNEYYSIMGWDIQPLINAMNGISGLDWL